MLLAQISLTLSLSLAIRVCHPSLPVGLPVDILCLYRAVVDTFLLVVLHLPIHMKGSIGERPRSSNSVPDVLFV